VQPLTRAATSPTVDELRPTFVRQLSKGAQCRARGDRTFFEISLRQRERANNRPHPTKARGYEAFRLIRFFIKIGGGKRGERSWSKCGCSASPRSQDLGGARKKLLAKGLKIARRVRKWTDVVDYGRVVLGRGLKPCCASFKMPAAGAESVYPSEPPAGGLALSWPMSIREVGKSQSICYLSCSRSAEGQRSGD